MNIKRFRQLWAYIEKHPETHRQDRWHCGTAHCVAGHAEILAAGYSSVDRCNIPEQYLTEFGAVRHWSEYGRTASKLARFIRREVKANRWRTSERAAHWLRLTDAEKLWLFQASRTKEQLSALARTGKFPRYLQGARE